MRYWGGGSGTRYIGGVLDGVGIRSSVSLGMDPLGVLTKSSSSVLSKMFQYLIDGIDPQEEETKTNMVAVKAMI